MRLPEKRGHGRMSKRWQVGVLVAALAVSAALIIGCGESSTSDKEATTTAATEGDAAAAEEFYKDNSIEFIVPYGSGGYDTFARLIAPFLEEQTGASVVVRNMPGGRTYKAQKYLLGKEPDGLTIEFINGKSVVLSQLVHADEAEGVDIRDYEYIGRMAGERRAIVVRNEFESIEDLIALDRKVKFGATGIDGQLFTPSVLAEVTEMDASVVVGFEGNGPIITSIMRGELDGFGASASSVRDASEQSGLSILCTVSAERAEALPDTPAIGELVELTEEQKGLVSALDGLVVVGRTVVTSPGVPQERVQ